MDIVTQAVLGSSVPQALSMPKRIGAATLFGALSGMAPDLDGLIRSGTDPLLYLEYHRQFTHSLVFIPVGSLLCALLLYFVFARRWAMTFRETYVYCLLGYATHGLLDACTSFGTQLLWPFSDERISWNTVSIVDPMFTLPLLILVTLGVKRNSVVFARVALIWVVLYLGFGAYQHTRVMEVGEALAAERGQTPLKIEAKPSFANLLLWKVIYEIEDGYYTDAVRAAPRITVYRGQFVPKLDVSRDLPWLDPDSQQARDLERFNRFSKGYLSVDPVNPRRITDMRYSMVPNEATGMWSIWLDPEAAASAHVEVKQDRDTSGPRRDKFARMMRGESLPE